MCDAPCCTAALPCALVVACFASTPRQLPSPWCRSAAKRLRPSLWGDLDALLPSPPRIQQPSPRSAGAVPLPLSEAMVTLLLPHTVAAACRGHTLPSHAAGLLGRTLHPLLPPPLCCTTSAPGLAAPPLDGHICWVHLARRLLPLPLI
jgi:hypothetical protein